MLIHIDVGLAVSGLSIGNLTSKDECCLPYPHSIPVCKFFLTYYSSVYFYSPIMRKHGKTTSVTHKLTVTWRDRRVAAEVDLAQLISTEPLTLAIKGNTTPLVPTIRNE